MKTVLITGANRGLGAELARVFDEASYNLILHSGRIDGNLRNQKTIDTLASEAQVKGLDILINNAGVHLTKPFVDMTIEEIREVIEVNLIAPILLTKAVWPIFLRQNSGLVININSLSGKFGGPGESIYSASKAGLAGFSDVLQYDSPPGGIRILNLNIGAMRTDMSQSRPDNDKFIDPHDSAKAILGFCENYPSLRITSADLKRRVY